MNFKLTFSLVLALLIAAIIFFLIPKGPQQPKSADSTTPLFSPAPKVKAFSFIQDGSLQETFQKDGDDWKMTAPLAASVDNFTVGDIASSIETLNYRRKFSPEGTGDKSAEATGTDKPRNIVKFTDDAGKDHTLYFGKRSEDGYFATLDGDHTVYVLASSPIDALDKDPDSFRNKTIKQVDTSKITQLEVRTPDSDVKLAKTGGKWMITSPVSARANETAVEDMLNAFASVQAIKFSELDKNITQLAHPSIWATAWVQDQPASTSPATAPSTSPATAAAAAASQPAGTPVTLQFGVFSNPIDIGSSPVYASIAGSPDVFTYARESYNKFNHGLQDLRDAAITPAPVRTATAFSISSGGATTLSVAKQNEAWTLQSGGESLVGDASSISDYLGKIADLRAIKFVDNAGDLKSIGLDPPQMKIDLTIPGQSQHEVLFVGKPETADPVTPIMRQGEPTVYLAQTVEANGLTTTKLALRDHAVDTLNADRIQEIDITGPDATAGVPAPSTAPATGPAAASAPATLPKPEPGLTLKRDGSQWQIEKSGKPLASNEAKVTSLLSDFTPLTALKYLDDKPVDASNAQITLTISLLEPVQPPPGTKPAAATAPASASAPSTAPSTQPATASAISLPPAASIGPVQSKLVTHTLRLYEDKSAAGTTWKAVWDHQSPAWTFSPTPTLIEHLTTDTYTPSPSPATAPTTNP